MFSRRRGRMVALVSFFTVILVGGTVSATWASETAVAVTVTEQTDEGSYDVLDSPDPADPIDPADVDGDGQPDDAGEVVPDATDDVTGETSSTDSDDPSSSGTSSSSSVDSSDAGGAVAPPPKDDAISAPTEAEAAAIAEQHDHSVVVDEKTTETSITEALPDGSFQLTSSSIPVRVEREGSWVDVDTRLTAPEDGYYSPEATTVAVQFSDGGVGPIARIQLPTGEWFTESWELGALPAPTIDGAAATYTEVIPGVDLRMAATALGMSEVLIVKNAEAAADPKLASLRLKVAGATLAAGDDGGTVAAAPGADGVDVSASGAQSVNDIDVDTMLRSNEPLMWDSSHPDAGPDGPGGNEIAEPVGSTLVGSNTVELDVASATTADDITYPLYIDPDWSSGKIHAWSINRTYPNTSYLDVPEDADGRGNQYVGYLAPGWTSPYPGDSQEQLGISFWQMGASGVANKAILSAHFDVTETWSSSCTKTGVQLYRTTNPGTGSTWNQSGGVMYYGADNSSPGWPNRPLDTQSAAYGSYCEGPHTLGFNAKAGVAAIAAAGQSEIVLALRAEHEDDTNSWKRFNLAATLTVTYNSPPNAPTNLKFTSPARGCGSSGAPVYVNPDVSLTMAATATDPEGQSISTRIRIMEGTNGSITKWSYTSGPQLSGSVPAVKVSTPASIGLSPEHLYAWGASSTDPYGATSQEPLCFFKLDRNAPAAPIVVMPTGDQIVGEPSGDLKISSTVDDRVAVFAYWWGEALAPDGTQAVPDVVQADYRTVLPACGSVNNGVHFVCANSSGAVTIKPAPIDTGGSFWVASYDKAGNVSAGKGSSFNAEPDHASIGYNGGHGWLGPTTTGPLAQTLPDSNTNSTGSVNLKPTSLRLQDGYAVNATGAPGGRTRPVLSFQGLTSLVRSNNGSDHGAFREANGPAGYAFEVLLGQLLQAETPPDERPAGVSMLYSCAIPGDEMTSLDSNCEIGVASQALGFVWTSADKAAAAVPGATVKKLMRCRQANGEHFTSTSENCESQRVEKTLGWIVDLKPISTGTQAIDTKNSYTVSAWVKLDHVTSSNYRTILSQDGSTSTGFVSSPFNLAVTPAGKLRFCVRSSVNPTAGADCAEQPNAMTENTWVFVTGIWDSVNQQVRVLSDGQLVYTKTHVPPANEITSTGPFTVGSSVAAKVRNNMWDGDIYNPTVFPGVADTSLQLPNIRNGKDPNE